LTCCGRRRSCSGKAAEQVRTWAGLHMRTYRCWQQYGACC
jgi:hypothetical protein